MIFVGVVTLIAVWIASYFVPAQRYRLLLIPLVLGLLIPFSSPVEGVQALAVLLFAYAVPTIVTLARKIRNGPAIIVVNVLLGWSIIGWIVALVWASTRDAQPATVT